MWSKIGKYLLYSLVWMAISGYVIYSATLSRRSRKAQTVSNIEIIISDSAMHGNLITTPMVRQWITDSGVKLIGRSVAELPLSEIEGRILRNGFVEKAKLYPTRSGVLKVELTQRRPVMRLLMNGYNGYVTREGYVFEAPALASLYMPIVTGTYRAPFPPSFRGEISEYLKSETKRFEEQIQIIEREKYPIFEQEQQNKEDMREVNRMFIDQGWFESDEAFEKRVTELRAKKAQLRKLYRYRARTYSEQIAKIAAKQQRVRDEEKKLIKRCEDFTNLINFVHIVENDKFWSSEVVQIIATQGHSGDLRVTLSVRSGGFEVVFGAVSNGDSERDESMEERFKKLMIFYEDGLRRVGWEKYQSINVEYKNQVVCK